MEPVAAEAEAAAYLPAHLLDEILRRVDLRDAVRTSALSRAWRRRWESVSGLSLSFPDGTSPSVIGGVLLLLTAPRISRFACEVNEESASHLNHWLIALSRRSVESISIGLNKKLEGFDLHSSIFSCTRLVSLHLSWCAIPPFPTGFSGFPVLEKLCLAFVKFLDHGERQLQSIICGSPLLRVLCLEDLDNPVDCVIEAPNLRSLSFYSDYAEDNCHFRELLCLQDAGIVVSLSSYPQAMHDCLVLLAAVEQVRVLTFTSRIDEVMIDSIPFTFYNLRTLELLTHFSDINPILSMFSLLRSSPNLEKLKIKIKEPEMVADWEFLNAQWTDDMCANLQIVEIISYSVPQWLPVSFMKFILSKASLLHTLYVNECLGSEDDPLNELLICRRASAHAQVLFKD